MEMPRADSKWYAGYTGTTSKKTVANKYQGNSSNQEASRSEITDHMDNKHMDNNHMDNKGFNSLRGISKDSRPTRTTDHGVQILKDKSVSKINNNKTYMHNSSMDKAKTANNNYSSKTK